MSKRKRKPSATYFLYGRHATHDAPDGVTVSKTKLLPDGDFRLDEYSWGMISLWFVRDHKFTRKERQAAFDQYCSEGAGCYEDALK